MRDHAERLRQTPTWKRIRAVTLMHDRQGRANPVVGQIRVVREKLRREEHPLVANRAAGHRRNVKLLRRIAQLLDRAAFGALAGDIQPPLQLFFRAARAVDENLLHHRFRTAGDIAQAGVVGRHVAEAERLEPFPLDRLQQDPFATAAKLLAPRQEEHRHAVLFGRRQRKTQPRRKAREKVVGDLQQNARSVAGRFVGTRGPAMHQVQQHLLAVFDDCMVRLAGNVDHGADAARIVLELRIVQTLRFRKTLHRSSQLSNPAAPGNRVRFVLVPTLRRGNSIPRRSGVGEVLTGIEFFSYTLGRGSVPTMRSHAGAWERGVILRSKPAPRRRRWLRAKRNKSPLGTKALVRIISYPGDGGAFLAKN